MNSKKAVLVVSFGTSHEDALQNNIAPTEAAIAAALPGYLPHRAFTSGVVIRKLARRGVAVDTVEQALDKLAAEGFGQVLVQPTHIICGDEAAKLTAACESRRGLFEDLRVGLPLLASTEDLFRLAEAVAAIHHGLGQDTALVMMGHGSHHVAGTTYAALDYIFKAQGRGHIFVGTVEGYPGAETVLPLVQKAGYHRVLLAPLLLVAGDHAKNDMAGDDDGSWKSLFGQAGFAVEISLKGLGEYPEIQALYAAHAAEAAR